MLIAQSDPDGAFFEDWSDWADLGGGTELHRGKPRPVFFCELLIRVPELRAPGFRVRAQCNINVHRLLIGAGAVQMPERQAYRSAMATPARMEARHWYYAPATRWRDMRAALPAVKSTIIDSRRRYYGG